MSRVEEPAFHLRAGESARDAVRRIATGEIDAVIAALEAPGRPETVHDVRKATKRLRALLRLVRGHLGERRYDRENRTFRDAARALSPARDAEVLVATANRLAVEAGGTPRGAHRPRRQPTLGSVIGASSEKSGNCSAVPPTRASEPASSDPGRGAFGRRDTCVLSRPGLHASASCCRHSVSLRTLPPVQH